MPALTIRLLGPPQVECDGLPLRVDTRKAVALLAYLALNAGPHAREALAGLLWPEYEPERARASLRRTLSALLKGLGGRFVRADRRAVELARTDVWVDVAAFHDLVSRAEPGDTAARLTEAVRLYRGEFLQGFSVRDSPEFDDWQFFTAEGLRRELAAALETLAGACVAQGDVRAAIDHARRWSALDPLHEPAHRLLMQLYAWDDQRGSALRQYRECVKVLDRELGVPALDETHELYRAIKENRLAGGPPARAPAEVPAGGAQHEHRPASATTSAGSPLVGRDEERRRLADAYDRAAGRGWLAVVEGEAGVGKTRLLEDLVEQARGAGATVVVVRCFEGEQQLPYGPFLAALRELLADGAAEERLSAVPDGRWADAARLLPELAARAGDAAPTASDDPAAQMRLLDALTTVLLTGLSGAPPGLLVVDDAHWADGASLALLSYALHRLGGRPVGFALAWRGDAVPTGHPLRRLARAAPETTSLVLSRLARPDVDRLIDAARPDLDPGTRTRLWEETEGVPLFVVEYLSALASGADLDHWTLATGVRDLLATRLEALGGAARQLLATAAVIGRSFDFSTLRDTSGRGDEETVEGLEELLERGLLREQPGERGEPEYDFTHHQVRAFVLGDVSLARRRLLHRRVAAVFAEQARRRRETAALRAQIAWHLQQAGDDDGAAEHYIRAGEEARAVHAHAEALGHFEAALALGQPDDAHLHAAIADLHTLLGRYDEAVRRYETAAALADPEDVPSLEHRLGTVHERLGDWSVAEDHFRAALRLLGGDAGGMRARVLADASLTAHRRGDDDHALELAGDALALADEAGDPAALAQALNLLGVLATSRGDTPAAVHHLDRSLAVAEAAGNLLAQAGALNNLALAHRRAGDTGTALPLAERAVQLASQAGDRHRLAAAIGNLGDLLHSAGRTQEAEGRVRDAVEILADIGGDEPRPEVWKLTEW